MDTSSTALTVTPAAELVVSPATEHMLVVASNPEQMQVAQAGLVTWFEQKVNTLRNEYREAQQSIEIARKSKWRLGPFQTVSRKILNELNFFEKSLEAVREGFCIVPNFPVDVLAIKTTAKDPSGVVNERWGRPTIRQDAETNLSVGEGEYKNPDAAAYVSGVENDEQGRIKAKWWEAAEFRDISFPMTFMKPRVLEATQRAMSLKIFDEIGILPERRKRKCDPVVCGRIIRYVNKEPVILTFLISWFIDTKQL